MVKLLFTLLDGVSIDPVITKIQASFITQLPERNGDFKIVRV